jgi:hypothetical protein
MQTAGFSEMFKLLPKHTASNFHQPRLAQPLALPATQCYADRGDKCNNETFLNPSHGENEIVGRGNFENLRAVYLRGHTLKVHFIKMC